jgi:adenylate kinase family enzyme
VTAVPPPGRRICVVGTSGCGKTFVAEALAKRVGLRYICNDAIIWGPQWTPTPPAERVARFDAATRDDGWTYDGNIGASADDQLMLSRCDTLVWLDLPRREVWPQVLRRTLRRLVTREPLWHGNVETWRMLFSHDSIVLWSLRTFARRRRAYGALFADPAYANRARIRLRSRREVNRWLASLPARA